MSGASAGMAAGPWGAAIGGVAGGVLGGFMGGNSNSNKSSLDSDAVNRALAAYMFQVTGAANSMVGNVGNIAGGLKGEVGGFAKDYTGVAAAQEQNLLGRVNTQGADYLAGIGNLGTNFSDSADSALAALRENTALLNKSQSADVGALVDTYTGAAGNLDSKLRGESDASIARFNAKTDAANADLKDTSFAEAARAKNEQMSLGDRFLANISASQQAYQDNLAGITENLRSGTPSVDAAAAAQQSLAFNQANLNQFTSMADSLSKAALQTRSDLLATADPRALELSQIADNNASAMMSGRIGADVQANLARSGAFRALNGGFGADSSMGRNLQARDLGLTSLDLMSRGDQMARDWRQLNYNTRVAGTQIDANAIMANNGLSSQQAIAVAEANAGRAQTANLSAAEIMNSGALNRFNSQNSALGTNYGNNFNALGNESTQRMNTLDNIYGTQLKAADEVRGQQMTLGQNLYNSNLAVAGGAMNAAMANTNSIYNNNWALANTGYNSGVGVAEKLYNSNTNALGSVYGTGINTAGNIYQGNLGVGSNIFSGRSSASTNAASMQASAEVARLNALASAYGNVAGSQVGMQQQQMLNAQSSAASNNQMLGSLFNSAASIAGNYIGSKNWNAGSSRGGFGSVTAMQNNTIPGTTGSYLSGSGWVPKATAA
jgi:hypothetical protein